MTDLYDLPDGWEWKTLGDKFVCDLVMGQSPKSDSYNSDGNGIAFFQGKKEFGDTYPTVEQYTTEPKKIAEVGDILLSVRAPVGPTNIANIQCCIGRGLGAIRPNTSNTLTNYLLYFFRNFELEISNKGKGSTFSAITKKELEETDIPLPPLSEQQRIVSKLDKLFEKIDKAIALHQKNMDEADVFMGSVLNDVFGELEEKYGKTDLKDITIITMGQSPSSDTYNSNGDGIPFFQGKKEFGKLNPTVEQYCTEPKKIAKDGDILMSVRAPVGPTNIANFDCAIGRGLCSIRAKDNQFSMYIYYFLNHFEKEIEGMGKGSTFSAINKTEIETLKVPFIPLHIQQKVATYLDEISEKIEKVKSIQKEKMDSLTALKASILDKAFRGEL